MQRLTVGGQPAVLLGYTSGAALSAYPPTLAISTPLRRRKGRTAHAVRREYTGVCVRARMRGHLRSPSYFAVSCGGAPLSIIKQYIDGQTRPL